MFSAVISTTAALGRPFVFEDESEVGLLASGSRAALDRTAEGGRPHISPSLARVQSALKNQPSKIPPASVTLASRLEIRPAPEMVSSGIPAIDSLTGGLPRGCLTEICGPASSGRTTLLLAALAAATRRGEFCVVVDASDALDPQSAAAAGVDLDRLLWVRCGDELPPKNNSPQRHRGTEKQDGCPISRAPSAREVGPFSQNAFDFDGTRKENISRQSEHRLEQVLRATDLLLESGGFGLIVLDLGDVPPNAARRIPLTTWFRFRRTIEHTPTVLLAIEQHPIAGSCSSLLLKLGSPGSEPEASAQNISLFAADESAAERRKIAAHGVSRGINAQDSQAPEGRKRINPPSETGLDLPYPSHAQLLTGLNITAELIRSRLERKPTRSTAAFASKTAWAG